MKIKVYKFGGASVKDARAVRNLAAILKSGGDERLVVVISAMGKTTNALEKVTRVVTAGDDTAGLLVKKTESFHLNIIRQLFSDRNGSPLFKRYWHQFEEEVQKINGSNYDESYDRLVSFGEMFSTAIIYDYLKESGFDIAFLDARKLIKTDRLHRDARVDWNSTRQRILQEVNEVMAGNKIVVTQGFIGSDDQGVPTTLGREGSDFSGAILASVLNAESLTIWKDVPGLLNADPKYFDDTEKIDKISYGETIELAFYGATIIHPKTIKPLQNKGIPLYVKSFLNPGGEGTVIQHDGSMDKNIPSLIFKTEQILLTISPRDYSFMDVDNLAVLFNALSQEHIKVNVMQNSALSLSICVDKRNHRVERFIERIKGDFRVKYNQHLTLMTIRHYNEKIVNQVVNGREVLLEQRSRTTLQLVMA